MSARRQFGSGAVAVLACSLLLCSGLSCSGSPAAAPNPTQPSKPGQPDAAVALQVMPAPYQLPASVSREVLLPGANGLLIVGGLTPSGASANTVTSLDPVAGATHVVGHLAAATHDAAGFIVGGRAYVAGGGATGSGTTVQAPAARP